MADATRGEIGRRRFLHVATVSACGLAAAGVAAPDAWAAPASATERRFSDLDGVPLHYWRWTDGTAGRRTEHRVFASSAVFHDRLIGWVRDLRDLAARFGGLQGMDRIVTAGTFVDKPGQHGLGQAIDVDQVRWSNGAITPYAREHESGDRRVVRRYLALDAVCRRHFRYVLDGRYNAAHADHLHLDLAGGALTVDRASRSDTVFVQQVLNAHLDAGLAVTGSWDRPTHRAFMDSLGRLGVTGDPSKDVASWRYWLFRSAACGFADRAFVTPPNDRTDTLRDHLERVVTEVQHRVTEVLGLLE